MNQIDLMHIHDDLYKKGIGFVVMMFVTKINEIIKAVNYLRAKTE